VIKGKARDVKHLSRSLFLAVWYEFEQRDGKSFLLTCVSALARLRERTGLSHKRVWPCRVYVSLSVKHDSCFQTDLREMKKQEKGERELRSLLNPSRSSRWSPHYMLKNTNHKHVVFLSVFYYAIPHIIHENIITKTNIWNVFLLCKHGIWADDIVSTIKKRKNLVIIQVTKYNRL